MNGYRAPAERTAEEIAGELDALVRGFEAHDDPRVRADAFALLERVDALHRTALTRLVAAIRSVGADAVLDRALDDPAVRMLLHLYDLLPGDDPAPVELALDQVRPYLGTHGAAVRLLGVTDGVVRLRLSGAPASGTHVPLAQVVETTLHGHFPALRGVEIEEERLAAPASFIPLSSVGLAPGPPARQPHAAGPAAEIPPGTIKQAVAGGWHLLVCNVDGAMFAVADRCPGSMLPLAAGALVEGELRCPWHGCRFDVRTGRRLDGVGAGLEVFPARVVDGLVQVDLPVEAAAGRGTP